MSRAVVPPGWPREVLPPAVAGWEETAGSWLLDLCPPDYRAYPVLRAHPVVLARFAALHVESAQVAVRRGLSEARAVLRGVAEPAAVDQAVLAWQAEEARLLAAGRAVALVEEALHGKRFVARL
jgi:hypothetical protein